jgi:DNA-binding beta-propeller fold protein YncE
MRIVNKINLGVLGLIFILSCIDKPKQWVYEKNIDLQDIGPIGMLADGDDLWLSDVDQDRLVKIDKTGKVLQEISGLIRPMHIAQDEDNIYIPQFGADNIVRWDKLSEIIDTISTNYTLDAPGGVDVGFGLMVVADFFNHRVLVNTQDSAFVIGKEGHDKSSLYYPTDIKITKEYINIADAYNNRVEVYDHSGIYVRTIGWQEDIKVAAGVDVSNQQIFITDFHGNRLLIYNQYGILQQTFNEHLDDPTDVLVIGNKLYVANFRGQNLSIFKFK